jgi:hypothetical protein
MTLEDIQKAIAELTTEKLAEFRAWFEEFDGAAFDAKIERDIQNGKLDRLAVEALRDARTRNASEI